MALEEIGDLIVSLLAMTSHFIAEVRSFLVIMEVLAVYLTGAVAIWMVFGVLIGLLSIIGTLTSTEITTMVSLTVLIHMAPVMVTMLVFILSIDVM